MEVFRKRGSAVTLLCFQRIERHEREMPERKLQVSIPQDEEFQRLLTRILAKPDEWYMERVDRAVKASLERKTVRVSRKR